MKSRKPNHKKIEYALQSISKMGDGLKESVIDWANIGRNAVSLAKKTLAPKCPTCGKVK